VYQTIISCTFKSIGANASNQSSNEELNKWFEDLHRPQQDSRTSLSRNAVHLVPRSATI